MATSHDRIGAAKEYLDAVSTLEQQTSIPEAKEICHFLRDCALFGEPTAVNGRPAITDHGWYQQPLPGPRQPIPLRIVPLFETDAATHEIWGRYLRAAGVALYVAACHSILIIRECPETDFVRACTLIHEGAHALRALRAQRHGPYTPSAPPPDLDRFQEESEVHALEGHLWQERGREMYERALAIAIEWLFRELSCRGQRPGETFHVIPLDELDVAPLLDHFLGPAPTWDAVRQRFTLLNTLAHPNLIDRSETPDKTFLKAGIIATIHQRMGLPAWL